MQREKKKKLASGDGFSIGFGDGFGVSLGELLGKAKPSAKNEYPAEKTEPHEPDEKVPAKPGAKLPKPSIQRRRAGCGGKTVTVVKFSGGVSIDLEALAKEMRRALGCGSRVEDGEIILQGDIGDRALEWFEKKG
ncbi:MAG: translation initiation factor [Synergistaceae bacterium]|nr:translation initiation factor [Synergistaceae bacterium]